VQVKIAKVQNTVSSVLLLTKTIRNEQQWTCTIHLQSGLLLDWQYALLLTSYCCW